MKWERKFVVSWGDALGLCSQMSLPAKRRATGMPSSSWARGIRLWRARFPYSRQNPPCPYHIIVVLLELRRHSSPSRWSPTATPPSRKDKVVPLGRMGKVPAASSAVTTMAPSNFICGNGCRSGLAVALFHAAGGPSPSSWLSELLLVILINFSDLLVVALNWNKQY